MPPAGSGVAARAGETGTRLRVKTSAIIAAYNEEQTIAGVIEALQGSPLIHEVIVVSDGSTDGTAAVVAGFPDVKLIRLARNQGKGRAMRHGVEAASHDLLFFVDGDMLDITESHIESLVGPVLRGECDMNVGVRHRGPIRNFLHLKASVGPILSGIRAMRAAVFHAVPVVYMQRFKIELALNYFCRHRGFRQRNTVIRGLGHVIKEHKRGLLDGLTSRGAMIREVVLLHFDLYLVQSWRWREDEPRPISDRELVKVESLD